MTGLSQNGKFNCLAFVAVLPWLFEPCKLCTEEDRQGHRGHNHLIMWAVCMYGDQGLSLYPHTFALFLLIVVTPMTPSNFL